MLQSETAKKLKGKDFLKPLLEINLSDLKEGEFKVVLLPPRRKRASSSAKASSKPATSTAPTASTNSSANSGKQNSPTSSAPGCRS
jgi:hypothetical protein